MFFKPGIGGFIFAFTVVVIYLIYRFKGLEKKVKEAALELDKSIEERHSFIAENIDLFLDPEAISAWNIAQALHKSPDSFQAEVELTNAISDSWLLTGDLTNKILMRRDVYNEAVNEYNKKISMFPNHFLARLLRYKSYNLFQ